MKPKTDNIPTSTECIEYTRTFVPSSMRSQYWKYFGFPSDNANNILTRQKIVCNLCGAAIAYNKNTSNLRTHLAAKHAELLVQLFKNNAANSGSVSNTARKRRYSNSSLAPLEFIHDETDSFLLKSTNNSNAIDNSNFGEIVEPVTQSDSKILLSPNNIEYKHFDVIENVTSAESNDIECDGANDAQSYRLDDLIVQKEKETIVRSGIESIVDMLITDLLKPNTLTGMGFQHLYGNFSITEVNASILTRFAVMECAVRNHLENLSQIAPFSLGIESFTNCEQYDILFIYFYYYDADSNELINVLYKAIEKTELCFLEVTKNLKMDNCAKIILNDPKLALILEENCVIPEFICLDAVLTNCMRAIFKEEVISKSFQEIYKATQDYLKEENTSLQSPEVFLPCPWTKLNFLQFVLDSIEISAHLQNCIDLTEIREFCEYIAPLKITMETIAEEELPFCTLIRPLIVKLEDEHFSIVNTENKYVKCMHKKIEDAFQDSILTNPSLKEATFFDARFQRDFVNKEEDRTQIQQTILKRFKTVINVTKFQESLLKVEQDNIPATSRKFGLKLFFNRISDNSGISRQKQSMQIQPLKTNIEIEFEKYNNEPSIDLEQCPIQWWKENSSKYPQLSKVAKFYLCVPCCVTRLYRIEPNARAELLNKRYMLRETTEERYLWLPPEVYTGNFSSHIIF